MPTRSLQRFFSADHALLKKNSMINVQLTTVRNVTLKTSATISIIIFKTCSKLLPMDEKKLFTCRIFPLSEVLRTKFLRGKIQSLWNMKFYLINIFHNQIISHKNLSIMQISSGSRWHITDHVARAKIIRPCIRSVDKAEKCLPASRL